MQRQPRRYRMMVGAKACRSSGACSLRRIPIRMPWIAVEPRFGRGHVDRAGDKLIDPSSSLFEYHDALHVVNNWRSSHSWPLNALQNTLRGRVKKVETRALVAQRLKRLTSIEAKLKRFSNMKLSQMQDLGGCRAVLKNIHNVDAVAAQYAMADLKNRRRHELAKKFDYIREPKSDGYRGIHLVYKYKTDIQKYQCFNGMRIEVQLRSQLQHAWANAVETVDTFTGQALKSSTGHPRWARFFLLMGSAMARRERAPNVPGSPSQRLVRQELRELEAELMVRATMRGWRSALTHFRESAGPDDDLFLIAFDIDKWEVDVTGFREDELTLATEAYSTIEKEISDGANKQAVLVGVESLEALRRAYPSYYSDTEAFLEAVNRAIE